VPPRAFPLSEVALFSRTVLCVSASVHASASAQLLIPPSGRGPAALFSFTLVCVTVSVPSLSIPPTGKKTPPALFPLTRLCVSVSVPKFSMPPTARKPSALPPCPPGIERWLTSTDHRRAQRQRRGLSRRRRHRELRDAHRSEEHT